MRTRRSGPAAVLAVVFPMLIPAVQACMIGQERPLRLEIEGRGVDLPPKAIYAGGNFGEGYEVIAVEKTNARGGPEASAALVTIKARSGNTKTVRIGYPVPARGCNQPW